MAQKTRECALCNGKGKEGEGQNSCSACDGDGYVMVEAPAKECPLCEGRGKYGGKKCSACEGAGWKM